MNFMLNPWVRGIVTVAIGVIMAFAMSRLYDNQWIFWVVAPLAAVLALALVLNTARASRRNGESDEGQNERR